MTEQQDVKEFMNKARMPCPDSPTASDANTRKLRVLLLAQELRELTRALGLRLKLDTNQPEPEIQVDIRYNYDMDGFFEAKPSLIEVYDAILDIQYVNIGAAVAFGLDLDPGWAEVQRSNMSKFIDGHEDPQTGKWIKGPAYSPANLEPIVNAMGWRAT